MDLISNLIKDLESNIYCRIKPSSISGVGVFAIRDIPQGTNPFKVISEGEFIEVPAKKVFENPNIPDLVKELINDMYVVENDEISLNTFGLNSINISYFLNHSQNPNMICNEEYNFIAMREIKVGEELTVNYHTYSDNNEFINEA